MFAGCVLLDFDLLFVFNFVLSDFDYWGACVLCFRGYGELCLSLEVALCFGVLMVELWSKLLGILCDGCLLC